jgi:hypothetical protein
MREILTLNPRKAKMAMHEPRCEYTPLPCRMADVCCQCSSCKSYRYADVVTGVDFASEPDRNAVLYYVHSPIGAEIRKILKQMMNSEPGRRIMLPQGWTHKDFIENFGIPVPPAPKTEDVSLKTES